MGRKAEDLSRNLPVRFAALASIERLERELKKREDVGGESEGEREMLIGHLRRIAITGTPLEQASANVVLASSGAASGPDLASALDNLLDVADSLRTHCPEIPPAFGLRLLSTVARYDRSALRQPDNAVVLNHYREQILQNFQNVCFEAWMAVPEVFSASLPTTGPRYLGALLRLDLIGVSQAVMRAVTGEHLDDLLRQVPRATRDALASHVSDRIVEAAEVDSERLASQYAWLLAELPEGKPIEQLVGLLEERARAISHSGVESEDEAKAIHRFRPLACLVASALSSDAERIPADKDLSVTKSLLLQGRLSLGEDDLYTLVKLFPFKGIEVDIAAEQVISSLEANRESLKACLADTTGELMLPGMSLEMERTVAMLSEATQRGWTCQPDKRRALSEVSLTLMESDHWWCGVDAAFALGAVARTDDVDPSVSRRLRSIAFNALDKITEEMSTVAVSRLGFCGAFNQLGPDVFSATVDLLFHEHARFVPQKVLGRVLAGAHDPSVNEERVALAVAAAIAPSQFDGVVIGHPARVIGAVDEMLSEAAQGPSEGFLKLLQGCVDRAPRGTNERALLQDTLERATR